MMSYEAKIKSPYEDSKDEQKNAGQSRVMDLLKELEKERKERPTTLQVILNPWKCIIKRRRQQEQNVIHSGKSKGK